MYWVVNVYFDNMLDATYRFEKEGNAAKCASQLKRKHQGNRMYRVEMEEVE